MDTIPIVTTPQTNLFLKAYENFKTEQEKRPKNYPLMLVEGDTGTGKTASIRNLPPVSTAIINIENKPLSFLGCGKFPYQFAEFKLPSDVDICIDNCFKEPTIKYIVMDSLTKYIEILINHSTDIKRNDKNNYAKFNVFNDALGILLDKLKSCGPKYVIILGIPELVELPQPDGTVIKSRRQGVWGKQWESKVEKEFTLVLFTKVVRVAGKSEYRFVTNNDGTNSAKTPHGMFKEELIDNDLNLVCKRVQEFYKLS